MKIRGRLIIAFLIMIFFPFVTGGLCVRFILDEQSTFLKTTYDVETENYETSLNPVKILFNLTMNDYTTLVNIADTDPGQFHDTEYLQKINHSLSSMDSFLILKEADSITFCGNQQKWQKISSLPGISDFTKGTDDMVYMDQTASMMIKKKDFHFSDGDVGQIFLVTDFSSLMPRWKESAIAMIRSFLIIILITALLLIVWIYRGIVYPLNILRIATKQIASGNLDLPIRRVSSDEIGDLCEEFEDMRIRLKSMLDERIRYEEATRVMLSSVSHDLKTPLTAIKGYAEGLLDGVAGTPEMQQKYLHTIYSKANDMTYLVDELSLFAKMEQSSLTYHFIPINLADYFTDCLNDFSLDLGSYGIALSIYNTTPADTMILADPEQLKRVIHNISNNACKYMDHKPSTLHVVIEQEPSSPVETPLYRQINPDGTEVVSPVQQEKFIRICIRDEGPGIAPDDLPRIFDQFYRADASRNSATGGSGLGLSIVSQIISAHGGKVWAESTLGEGTSIYFTLKQVQQGNGGTYEQNTDH